MFSFAFFCYCAPLPYTIHEINLVMCTITNIYEFTLCKQHFATMGFIESAHTTHKYDISLYIYTLDATIPIPNWM